MHFARRVHPSVTRNEVKRVIANCDVCQSIDPAPVKWQTGKLGVDEVWQRVAMDITHFRGRSYLTLIDCGPSRFSIWRPLRLQTSAAVIEQLDAVFWERGAPAELLTDNDPAFRSRQFEAFAVQWGMRMRFRCAHAASGNGIVERCHRTIKVIAARKGCTVAEAVYWHNISPRDDETHDSAPAEQLYRYKVRVRGVDTVTAADGERAISPYQRGDSVWVRPPGVRCDQRYEEGTVTDVISEQAVAVDGMPRHTRDLRPRAQRDFCDEDAGTNGDDEPVVVRFAPVEEVAAEAPLQQPDAEEPRGLADHPGRTVRARRPPGYLSDYITTL